MPADGQTFIVGQGGAVKAGDTRDADAERPAAPSQRGRRTWRCCSRRSSSPPARGAPRGAGSAAAGPPRAQLQARRDKLFSELTALEEQRRKGTVDARVYATRREHLVTALEDLYAGLEREVA